MLMETLEEKGQLDTITVWVTSNRGENQMTLSANGWHEMYGAVH